jgi:hypothetical protein
VKTLTESEVRKLRNAIYGEISDRSWEHVRNNWMKPDNVKWLLERPQNQTSKEALYGTH